MLLAVDLEDSVIILSDTQTSDTNTNGNFIGVKTNLSQKVKPIKGNAIMATSGLGTALQAAADLTGAVLSTSPDSGETNIINCCTAVLEKSKKLFQKYNPHAISSLKVGVIVAGIDNQTKCTFLYSAFAEGKNNIHFKKANKRVMTMGTKVSEPLENKVNEYLSTIKSPKNPEDLIKDLCGIFQDVCRNVEGIGKEVFGIYQLSPNSIIPFYINDKGISVKIPCVPFKTVL